MKDLRDTFASQLLACTVTLGYVAVQLGHADLQVTAQHYARWCRGESYRDPIRLLSGEVPVGLLARVASLARSTPIDPTSEEAISEPLASADGLDAAMPIVELFWRDPWSEWGERRLRNSADQGSGFVRRAWSPAEFWHNTAFSHKLRRPFF